MKFICLTLLLIQGIIYSQLEQYKVMGPSDPVFADAGEEVILPCFTKPSISVVDMRVEWYKSDLSGSLVHLYEDHEDRNTGQIQSYRGRTELIYQELQRGNASLKLSSVKVSDEGRYKCFIQSKSWFNDATIDVKVEAVGSPPVITVDGFDGSGGLHLQCESEGWFPEPDLEWLDSEGERMSPETTETQRNTDRFSVKQTIVVHQRDSKIYCRVKLRHHMLEAQIITTSNMFNSRTQMASVILTSVSAVFIVIAGILIVVFVYKYRDYHFLQRQRSHIHERITCLRKHKVNVTLDADSAHTFLIVSDNRKEVKKGKKQRKELDRLEEEDRKFDKHLGVLGKEGFSSGCFYFEVQVKGHNIWDLGVTRESADRKGPVQINPENGYWIVSLRYEQFLVSYDSAYFLPLRVQPQRVGVFVDYDKGFVSFYEVESSSHIYSFTGQSFNEKLYSFVSFGYKSYIDSTPLTIFDDY